MAKPSTTAAPSTPTLRAPTSRTSARLDAGARALLVKAAEQLSLSARAYHRVLKVARTIADLDGAANVARVHAAEALTYRFRPARSCHAVRVRRAAGLTA